LIFLAGPVGGGTRTPDIGLRIQILDIGPLTAGKEAIPDIAYSALDASFFVAPRNGYWSKR